MLRDICVVSEMFRSSVFHNQPLNNWNASDANMSFAFRDLAAASSKRMLMMLSGLPR